MNSCNIKKSKNNNGKKMITSDEKKTECRSNKKIQRKIDEELRR
jgi:hypothetical protein